MKAHIDPAVVPGITRWNHGIHGVFDKPRDSVLNLVKLNRRSDRPHLNQPDGVQILFGELFEQIYSYLHMVAGAVVAEHDRLDHNWLTLRS